MDRSQRWYPNQEQYSRNDSNRPTPNSRSIGLTGTAADSVQNAQRLLGVYPMASATPTNHVVRHLSSMNITAAPPSFIQPAYYSQNNNSYTHGNPPPYSEYDQQLAYISGPQIPVNDNGYWENTRNDAVRLLGEQAGPSYSYSNHGHQNSRSTPSTFQTTPFAQSIFQLTAPSTAYPTPPPPGITTSSSSLAFALGHPQQQPQTQRHSQPLKKIYKPEESATFFNEFLERKTQEMNSITSNSRPVLNPPTPVNRPSTPQKKPRPAVEESPDPLALKSSPATSNTTPRKRKPVVEIESPSFKRFHFMKPVHNSSLNVVKTPSKLKLSGQAPTPGRMSAFSTPTKQPSSASTTPKRNLAYVDVPLKPWLTPSSSRKSNSDFTLSQRRQEKMKLKQSPDDLGGYGSVDDYPASPTRVRGLADSIKSSARRTGDRDERAPLEKFTAFIEDIFEAEDALPPDTDISDLPEFFSPLTTDSSHPLLHPNIIRKLIKYIGQIARPTKRLRQVTGGTLGTPRAKGRMAEVDSQILSRLLKLLDRNVKTGEDIDPFLYLFSSTSAKSSPRKPKASAKNKKNDGRSKSQSPKDDEDMQEENATEDSPSQKRETELTEADFDRLNRVLDVARDSILAADCCIALLGSDRLTKQLYSEELITGCLSTIKNQLTKIIYPFVEASTETALTPNNNPLLHYIAKNTSSKANAHRNQLSETFQAISAVLPRINTLINAESVAMSDSIIIQAVYIAIGPFFVVESGGDGDVKSKKDSIVLRTLGRSAMRGLRLDALSLIRSIFANHDDQRSWIIEEILTSLIKLSDSKQKAGQFRLRDGRSIRTVSALLLQLVQTSAHDVRIDARKIEKARQNKFALRRQESLSESQQMAEPFLEEHDHEEIRLYGSGLESATKAAKTIVLFLNQRSGKGKATKNSNEAEYRAIFDNLINDLLVVLFWPEWPAAGLLLSIASKFMVSSLDDVKSNAQADNNAAKTIALDHLGVIAARIRASTLKVQQDIGDSRMKYKGLKPLDEIVSNIDIKGLTKFLDAHKEMASHLCKRSSEDQAYDSARELTAAMLGQELASALKQLNIWIDSPEEDDDLNIKDQKMLTSFGTKLKNTLREVWKDPSTDVFDIGSQEEVAHIDRIAEEMGTIQSLRNSFQPILSIILSALDAPAIFMRTKALRALGQIVTSDATILTAPNVRRGIESHLLDSSPAVRDAAVELIGKYMIDSPTVAGDYYQKIADRIADTGLGVRKRVIKLLKAFYTVTDDNARHIDIATRIVLRMLDEDDTVKDLAIKTIEELWFPVASANPSIPKARPLSQPNNVHDKGILLSKVSVIMGTSANFKDRQSPLEDMLHKIMAVKEGSEASSLHVRYTEICETLIDGLVDASDLPGFTIINCIRTIYLFTTAYPSILSGTNASTLLPYLKNASTTEELATSDYLLKIFRASIPHMPKTAAKFGQELQGALQPMILKPSTGGGVHVLQEAVGCMCVVVQHLTHDFVRLVNLLKSCNARLQQFIKRPVAQEMPGNESRTLLILIFIVSLLGENCNFDHIRQEYAALTPDIDSITKGPVVEHIYDCLLVLYNKYDNASLRGRILQCLGPLFRAQPTLMTLERSSFIMDAIFASSEEEAQGRLLRIMQEFLTSEATKHTAQQKDSAKSITKSSDVNMDELVGNTDGFADSGVSSAVVQRYLDPILNAALSQNVHIQGAAIDVLSFTIKQGLAHPLQSFPIIVALETSPVTNLSNRASALHAILHGKHASLLNARYSVSARASFDYQKKVASSPVQGFRSTPPMALLQRWYSLVREKRPTRQDFLKSLVKVFQDKPTHQSSQDDVDFTRYMAENFSAFDYKTQEEVFTVIKYLTIVLSTTGMQILETISPSHLLSHLHGPSHAAQSLITSQTEESHIEPMATCLTASESGNVNPTDQDQIALMRTSVIIAMVMLLKAHLKTLYSLSEDKCNKFVVGKKSAIGDRPATKRHDNPISWDRLPYATTPIYTTSDVEAQKSRFLDIWNEDGLTAEPDEDFS